MKFIVIAAVISCILFSVSAESQQNTTLPCAFCQLIVKFAEQQINSNVTLNKLDAVVTSVCGKLKVSDWCQQNLLPLIPKILKLVQEKEPPTVVCKQIRLCKPAMSEVESDDDEEEEVVLVEAEAEEEEFSNDELEVAAAILAEQKPNSTLGCAFCQVVIKFAEKQITSNVSQSKLDALISKVCSQLQVSEWCNVNILPLIPKIFQLLGDKYPPELVCLQIRLCRPQMEDEDSESFEAAQMEIAAVREGIFGGLKCSICTNVMNTAKSILGNDKSMAGVQRAVGMACGKIPFASDICKVVVGAAVQNIAQDLINKVDSKKICGKVKMC